MQLHPALGGPAWSNIVFLHGSLNTAPRIRHAVKFESCFLIKLVSNSLFEWKAETRPVSQRLAARNSRQDLRGTLRLERIFSCPLPTCCLCHTVTRFSIFICKCYPNQGQKIRLSSLNHSPSTDVDSEGARSGMTRAFEIPNFNITRISYQWLPIAS
jgi:hypothetical protein